MGRIKHNLIEIENDVTSLAKSKEYRDRQKKNMKTGAAAERFFKYVNKGRRKKNLFSMEETLKKRKSLVESASFFDFGQTVDEPGLEVFGFSAGASSGIPQSWAESIKSSDFGYEVEEFEALGEHELPRTSKLGHVEIPLDEQEETPLRMPARTDSFSLSETASYPETSGLSKHDRLYAQGLQNIVSQKTEFRPALNPQFEPEEETRPRAGLAGSHAIFDEISKGLQTAKTFDLGDISVQADFDAFDMVMEEDEARAVGKIRDEAKARQLSEMDIIEDFALMSTEAVTKPAEPEPETSIPVPGQKEKTPDKTPGDSGKREEKNNRLDVKSEKPPEQGTLEEIVKRLKDKTEVAEAVKKAVSELLEKLKLPDDGDKKRKEGTSPPGEGNTLESEDKRTEPGRKGEPGPVETGKIQTAGEKKDSFETKEKVS